MALAHRPVLPPFVEQRALTFQLAARVAGHPAARGRIENAGALVREPCSISLYDPRHAGFATVIRSRLGAAVEPCDCRANAAIVSRLSRPRAASRSNRASWSKRAISTTQSTGSARTSQGERPVARARHRHHSAIQGRRRASIETHFGLAAVAFGDARRREIEVVESNRALELPGARAREKHDGRMRVDSFDRHPAMGG